jgi:DNA-binding Lrp family transcriptional regulator
MRAKSIKKRLHKYYKIYEQIFDNPSIPLYQITKNTGISRSTVSRYLMEMYENGILKGPMIFLHPSTNYKRYALFCAFDDPYTVYQGLNGFPKVISRALCSGRWNVTAICESLLNFCVLKGFRYCVTQGEKGATHLPKVPLLDWDAALDGIYQAITIPREHSTLYEEIPTLPWKTDEWTLFEKFKYNIRMQAVSILKSCNIRYEKFQAWNRQLSQYTHIQSAFYPRGIEHYFFLDFLFQSPYHRQLVSILGQLPATSIFFSVDTFLLARIPILNRKEKDDLFRLIFHLGEKKYFTTFYQAMLISTSQQM